MGSGNCKQINNDKIGETKTKEELIIPACTLLSLLDRNPVVTELISNKIGMYIISFSIILSL